MERVMVYPWNDKLNHLLHGPALVVLTGTLTAMPFATATGGSEERSLDTRQTLRARQALLKDPLLAKLNLGVSVKSTMATLWGDVDDLKLSRRAEELIRQVPGVLAVQNNLNVLATDDPLREIVKQQAAKLPLSVALPPRSAGTLTSQPPTEPAVTLLPPTLAPASANLLVPAAKPDDLSSSVEKLTGSDPRFRGLRPEIDGGIIRLRGSAGRWEDVMELAQLISHVSGVERVILQDVRTPR
jgi:BON domain